MDEKLLELIRDLVRKVTGKENLTYDTDFVQDLALSSFDLMSIVYEFEDLFDVEVAVRDVWQLHKVQDVIDYIKKNGLEDKFHG